MTEDPGHVPVLLEETIAALDPRPGDTVVDCTAGRGGHAVEIARRIGPGGTLLLFDLDPGNLEASRARVERETGLESIAIHRSFAALGREGRERELRVNGVLADLGFASNQVDDAARGFSFRADGALDMRLDPTAPVSAADLVNGLEEAELARIIREFGEDPMARRIARKVAEVRAAAPIQTTARLADVVREAYGSRARASRTHPATRTFQALRIAVNDELGALRVLLDDLASAAVRRVERDEGWLAAGARIALISFHSLEDRLVKRCLADLASRDLLDGRAHGPLVSSDAELAANPRARSAKLRVATVGAARER